MTKTNNFSKLNSSDKNSTLKQKWTKQAELCLLGRTIVGVRYLTDGECDGWDNASIVIHLDNGSFFYPVSDDEGNDAGAIFYHNGEVEEDFPVICNY